MLAFFGGDGRARSAGGQASPRRGASHLRFAGSQGAPRLRGITCPARRARGRLFCHSGRLAIHRVVKPSPRIQRPRKDCYLSTNGTRPSMRMPLRPQSWTTSRPSCRCGATSSMCCRRVCSPRALAYPARGVSQVAARASSFGKRPHLALHFDMVARRSWAERSRAGDPHFEAGASRGRRCMLVFSLLGLGEQGCPDVGRRLVARCNSPVRRGRVRGLP